MYKIVNSNKENNLLNIEVRVDGKPWTDEVNKALKLAIKNVSIPGFRKGKIPENKAKEYVNFSLVYEKAANKILNSIFEKILLEKIITDDNDVIEVNPEVNIQKIDNDFIDFVFKFDLMPPITLPNYKKIENIKESKPISDEDLENHIKFLMKADAESITKEDSFIEMYDLAIIDFKGFVDGKQLDSATANDYELEIGSKSFIEGFESELLGMKKNETKTINLTFPNDYHATDLQGKPVTFEVLIKDIKTVKYPELNIEYVKSLKNKEYSNSNSIDEFKETVKKQLSKNSLNAIKNANISTIKNFLVENSQFGYIPKKLVNDQAKKIMDSYLNQIKQYKMELKDVLAMQNISEEKFLENINKEAETNVKYSLVLEKIAEENNVECAKQDLENKINEIIVDLGTIDEETRKNFVERLNLQKDLIETMVISDKIIDFIINENKK